MPAVRCRLYHRETVVFEQPPPCGERLQVLVDVLLRRALLTKHFPADEVLIGHHDAEARPGFRDALHFFQPQPHVQKVLERAEARDVVECASAEGESPPCPPHAFSRVCAAFPSASASSYTTCHHN